MRTVKSEEARRTFRDLLDEVERDPDAAVEILRYTRPVAVIVSAEWYSGALATLREIRAEES